MLYNKYRRQWLVFVVVVGGRRCYRGRVVMGYDRCSEFCVVEIGPAQKSREKDASRIPTVKFYLPAAF